MQGIVERQKSRFFREHSKQKKFKGKFAHEMNVLGQVQN